MKIQTGHGTITLTALLAIYSISMVTSLPGLAISPILGDLRNIFKDASDWNCKCLNRCRRLSSSVHLTGGRLSLRINKKVLIIGLSIFFGCSVIYPFSNSLWLLLLVSALLGVGAGMVIPFSTGLIADNFTKRYRTRQLGIASAITNISLVFATFLAGVLASINWRYAFLVYCLSGISLLFAFKLNSTPPAVPQSDKHSNDTPVTTNHNWPIALMFLYYFITFIVLTVPLTCRSTWKR
ncbi:MAG: MFS transporter [Butyricimonas faecalis]